MQGKKRDSGGGEFPKREGSRSRGKVEKRQVVPSAKGFWGFVWREKEVEKEG